MNLQKIEIAGVAENVPMPNERNEVNEVTWKIFRPLEFWKKFSKKIWG